MEAFGHWLIESKQEIASALLETSWALGSAGFIIVGLILKYLNYRYIFIILGTLQIPFIFIFWFILPNVSFTEDTMNRLQLQQQQCLQQNTTTNNNDNIENKKQQKMERSSFNIKEQIFTNFATIVN